jgi:hypothetical protein
VLLHIPFWFCIGFAIWKASVMHAEWMALRTLGDPAWKDAADGEAFCLMFALVLLNVSYWLSYAV